MKIQCVLLTLIICNISVYSMKNNVWEKIILEDNPVVDRVKNQDIQEIILCTNQTPEGEATAMFVSKRLKNMSVIISCLARGLPVGAILGNSDKLTVYKTLSNKKPH